MDADPVVSVETLVQFAGSVGAAVIDDDQFDRARIVHVEDVLDSVLQGGDLVVDRHQDGQLHEPLGYGTRGADPRTSLRLRYW